MGPPVRAVLCSGLLRSRAFPETMRNSRAEPLVDIEAERVAAPSRRCRRTFRGGSLTFGTTARRISLGGRQVVESANSALKGSFTNLRRGFFRVLGLVKTTVFLGFTLAAHYLDRIRSFKPSTG